MKLYLLTHPSMVWGQLGTSNSTLQRFSYILTENKIVVYEMINIFVCINEWGADWTNKHILLYCDNRAVVDIMDRHKTRDSRLGKILRDILYVMAKYNIHLEVKHVMGEKNPIADALSRVHMDKSVDCIQDLLQKGFLQSDIKLGHYVVDNGYF